MLPTEGRLTKLLFRSCPQAQRRSFKRCKRVNALARTGNARTPSRIQIGLKQRGRNPKRMRQRRRPTDRCWRAWEIRKIEAVGRRIVVTESGHLVGAESVSVVGEGLTDFLAAIASFYRGEDGNTVGRLD